QGEDGDSIYAATGGTFAHSNDNSDSLGSFNMYAESNGGTTLQEDYATDVELVASDSGNDTLHLTNSTDSSLDASGTSGNVSLISEDGSYNTFDASGSTGHVTINAMTEEFDTIYGGDGGDTIHAGSEATVYAGSGNDTIYADGAGDTINVGSGV